MTDPASTRAALLERFATGFGAVGEALEGATDARDRGRPTTWRPA